MESLWRKVERTKALSNPTLAPIIELVKYFSESIIDRHDNPLVWWDQRQNVYPRLYEIAKKTIFNGDIGTMWTDIFQKWTNNNRQEKSTKDNKSKWNSFFKRKYAINLLSFLFYFWYFFNIRLFFRYFIYNLRTQCTF